MNILIGLVVAFCIGAGCRYFDIPVPSPPVLPGALLVVAMTLGYTSSDRLLSNTSRASTTKHLCGGPTGQSTPEVPQRVQLAAQREE
jgi:XapX domain-containing protein